VVSAAVAEEAERIRKEEGREATIAYLADGPYGIPFLPEAGRSH
jgi:hypothetical protein